MSETRERLARLLNVQPNQLAFGPNTTYGLNVCTHGIAWREGDNVVVPAREFPSVQYALAHLLKRGVTVRRVAWRNSGPTVEQIMAQVDSRTRAVMCSAIAWDTGHRIDLETLGARCAKAGCLLIVDGTVRGLVLTPLDPQHYPAKLDVIKQVH
ncbi:MAG: aminotransferase class V-fold PLP-dependent enzyme [Anaerolineae bacterium]|nr:aminotransferase class V-fold PLP-dependent enzyme [Anaerolineae bacterium]